MIKSLCYQLVAWDEHFNITFVFADSMNFRTYLCYRVYYIYFQNSYKPDDELAHVIKLCIMLILVMVQS